MLKEMNILVMQSLSQLLSSAAILWKQSQIAHNKGWWPHLRKTSGVTTVPQGLLLSDFSSQPVLKLFLTKRSDFAFLLQHLGWLHTALRLKSKPPSMHVMHVRALLLWSTAQLCPHHSLWPHRACLGLWASAPVVPSAWNTPFLSRHLRQGMQWLP